MNKEPKVLTRMRLSCCWGDNLNEKELNEVVDYINNLQQENEQLKLNHKQLSDNNLKTHYEIKPSFTTRKIKQLQQELNQKNKIIEEIKILIENYKHLCKDKGLNMHLTISMIEDILTPKGSEE